MLKKLFFFVAVSALLLTACGGQAVSQATPTPSEPWTTHTDDGLGISVQYPEAWALKSDLEGGLYISNDASNFDSPIIVNGVGVIISSFSTADFNNATDPAEILDTYARNFEAMSANLEQVGETESLTINGKPAAFARYRGTAFDQEGEFTFTTIVNGDVAASVLTIDTSEGAVYSERVRRIAESLAFLP